MAGLAAGGPGCLAPLDESTGVVVVEATDPLRAADFESLGRSIDTWLETHATLHGLVLHAREIPGWTNRDSVVRHLRFVQDHHRRIDKIALAVDGRAAGLAPDVAKHFVQADLRWFAYDQIEEATAWAAS